MNDSYYQNPTFPGQPMPSGAPNQQTAPTPSYNVPPITAEQSYIENILRLNRGKLATFYYSFPDSIEWRDKVFEGVIEQSGRDHIVVSDPKTGKWYLLLMIYLNYITFDEKINYSPTFVPQNTQ
ncbi:MAG: spore coat protein GerQ [Bacilli bacterium]